MKAVVTIKYGPPDVLELQEIDKPTPKSNEVLVRIHATTVTVSDCIVRSGKINLLLWLPMRLFVGFGRPRKKILGFELAGEIEAIGRKIKRFKIGDRVFAFTGMSFGAFAEFVCLPEDGLYMPKDALVALKPSNLSYEEAATVPSRGTLALYYLKKGIIKNAKKVLIYGASGGVGTYAVQLAKYFGADVTGICSTSNLELVKALGADKVIDYQKDDFALQKELYDLVFDAVGKKKDSRLKAECKKVLTSSGVYISVDDGTPKISLEDLLFLKELIEEKKIKPVIDKVFPLEKIVEAHRYVEKGHKKGNIVVKIDNSGKT